MLPEVTPSFKAFFAGLGKFVVFIINFTTATSALRQ